MIFPFEPALVVGMAVMVATARKTVAAVQTALGSLKIGEKNVILNMSRDNKFWCMAIYSADEFLVITFTKNCFLCL